MNQKEFTDALKKTGITKKEADSIGKKLLPDRTDTSKNFSSFTCVTYPNGATPNGATPKIRIARTESLCGEVHVLGFIKLHKIESIKFRYQEQDKPLLLLRLFVSHGAPPDFYRYTGAEPLFVMDLSLPDIGHFPEIIYEEKIRLARTPLQILTPPLRLSLESVLQLYSVRAATPEERKNVFELYDVIARAAEGYTPRKTARNPKGAGRRRAFDHKEDERIFKLWSKWREQPGNGRRGEKAFIDEKQIDITKKGLERLINRTQKRLRS